MYTCDLIKIIVTFIYQRIISKQPIYTDNNLHTKSKYKYSFSIIYNLHIPIPRVRPHNSRGITDRLSRAKQSKTYIKVHEASCTELYILIMSGSPVAQCIIK